MEKTELYDPGFCVCDYDAYCVCPPEERCIRYAISFPPQVAMPPDVENEWLDWIDSVEGWKREEYEGKPACEIAAACLQAMADFCRDKGLL